MSNLDQGGKILKNTSVNLPYPLYIIARREGLNFSKTLQVALVQELRKKGIVFQEVSA